MPNLEDITRLEIYRVYYATGLNCNSKTIEDMNDKNVIRQNKMIYNDAYCLVQLCRIFCIALFLSLLNRDKYSGTS